MDTGAFGSKGVQAKGHGIHPPPIVHHFIVGHPLLVDHPFPNEREYYRPMTMAT